jgi:hypothetical protein
MESSLSSPALSNLIARVGLENSINWDKISGTPLTSEEIIEFKASLNMDIISSTQMLTPEVVYALSEKLNFYMMSSNKTLPIETVLANVGRLDLALSQRHHRYNDQMIYKLLDIGVADPVILFKYQTLTAPVITAVFEKYKSQEYAVVRNLMNLLLVYQVLTEEFMDGILAMEESSKAVLFDRELLFEKQKTLSIEWLQKRIVADDPIAINLLLKNRILDDDAVLKYVTSNGKTIDMETVFRYQKLSEESIQYYLELLLTVDIKSKYFELIVRYQTYDIKFLHKCLFGLELPEVQQAKIYNIVYLRTLKSSDPMYLPWNENDITSMILPMISMEDLLLNEKVKHTQEFIESIIAHKIQNFNWHLFFRLQKNSISTATVQFLENSSLITDLEKWYMHYCCETNPNPYDYWWTFESARPPNLVSVAITLEKFVRNADWVKILNIQPLPEWIIDLFSKYKDVIEAKMNGISYWWKIGRYQKLSPKFIADNLDKFDIRNLIINQTLTPELLTQIDPYLSDEDRQLIRAQ